MSEKHPENLIRAWGHTDRAQRANNEDALLIDEDLGLMVVADGVGGLQAGEVASSITCAVLDREITAGSSLEKAIQTANAEVLDAVERGLGKKGMATTVVALLFFGPAYELAWVGDSRAYLWDGSLALLSRDQTYVESLVESGQITVEEAVVHPKKNIIEQAVGIRNGDKLRIGRNYGQLQPGQVLLLCSDGLNDALPTADIATILSQESPLETRCQLLVDAAVEAGGRDNVTVVLIEGGAGMSAVDDATQPNLVWRYDVLTASYESFRDAPPRAEVGVSPIALRGEGGRRYLWLSLALAAVLLLFSSFVEDFW